MGYMPIHIFITYPFFLKTVTYYQNLDLSDDENKFVGIILLKIAVQLIACMPETYKSSTQLIAAIVYYQSDNNSIYL